MKPITKLQKALSAGQTVLVEFIKKDGTLRRAKVTKNLSDIPPHKHPKHKSKNHNPKLITLFDTLKNDWICCYPDKITLVKSQLTPAQARRKAAAAARWKLVKTITSHYHFTIGQALSIASGKTIEGCNLSNLSLY